MVSQNNVEWEIVRMVTRIALAMRRMNEAFRHRAKEHDASVLTNGVEALDSKKVAGSPGRRVAGSLHLCPRDGHEHSCMAAPVGMSVRPA